MITYKRSATSPEALEVVLPERVSELHPDMRIEVPDGWHVLYSSQKNILTVEPLVVASVQAPLLPPN